MPEYLAPGVFVEETSFRSKSIEGVSTTTTGFIGPTRYGPVDLENELITSLGEFERTYGSRQQLTFGTTKHHNYVWHAVRAFFEEGGKRLYISRVFRSQAKKEYGGFDDKIDVAENKSYDDGHARARHPLQPTPTTDTGTTDTGTTDTETPTPTPAPTPARALLLAARYPGTSGNMKVRITLRVGQNILSYKEDGDVLSVGALQNKDVVLINEVIEENGVMVARGGDFYLAELDPSGQWTFTPKKSATPNKALKLSDLKGPPLKKEAGGAGGAADLRMREIHVITAAVSILPTADSDISLVWDGLALDPKHTRAGAEDSLSARFQHDPKTPSRNREIPIFIRPQAMGDAADGLDLLQVLISGTTAGGTTPAPGGTTTLGIEDHLKSLKSSDEQRSINVTLTGGNDGERPVSGDYEGKEVDKTTRKTGLKQFQDLEDISIVAAPGATFGYEDDYGLDAAAINNLLISHCERMKYRIAVLDSGDGQTLTQVRAMRAKLDSSYAALYYPWVKVMDPVTRQPIDLPPSGFVAGIYARNDVRRAVYKAPANEVVTSAIGFESILNTAQQEAINPEGINAFRFFEGRGFRLWGARTVSSDPEWKYVNLRRYFAYLERSIDKGTQWAVFEPNGPQLWANIRRTIEDFLLNEWQSGALLGDRPDAAYFVKCDRSTMTQNDLDNGRLICLVGVAPLRPAEFVIIRIGQWTGDRK